MQIVSPGNSLLRKVTKTITFTGAAGLGAQGAVPIFTVTGAVDVSAIMGFCTVTLVGVNSTIALGVTGATTLFIGATSGPTLTATAGLWVSTTATATGIALPATVKDIAVMTNIIGTVGTADITAGVLTITAYWLPISTDGSVV